MNGLIGVWIDVDIFNSEVEYSITEQDGHLTVSARDMSDNESAEIYDIKQDDSLSFAAYWPSSGRLCKCSFRLVSKDQIQFTFTYTDHSILKRK